MECLRCNSKPATKKCGNCKIVWYCSKKCQTLDWELHKTYCIEDEYLIWSQNEKINFYDNINNLQTSYKNKAIVALNSYKLAKKYFDKILELQHSYTKTNYEQIINTTIIYLRDAETEWRLFQNHSKEMIECNNNKDDDWSTVLVVFYEQLYEESSNYRVLICLSIAHCYFSLRLLHLKDDINNILYKECKNYYELALLYKQKIKTVEYIDNINNLMVKLEQTKRFIQKTI